MFAVPPLEALVGAGHAVPLVVTQPDRPKGRGMELALSPVKQKALELGLAVTQPEKIKNNAEFRAQLEALAPDCIVVVGYGRIIPRWMLDLPAHGNINLHASLLPKYRGAAPIQWAIANGERVTGNTTMRIDEGLDTGDILLQREMAIGPEDTSVTLAPRLAAMGADAAGGNPGSAGGTSRAAHAAGQRTRNAGADSDARRRTHPLCARHCADDLQPASRLSAVARIVYYVSRQAAYAPRDRNRCGRGYAWLAANYCADGEQLLVGCAEQTVIAIRELQLEGKRRMSAREFINGYQPKAGEGLGS